MRLLWSAFGTFALSVAAHAATLQEQYTAAQSAYDAGRMAEARAGFAAVLPRLDANPKMKSQAAVVRSRMGAAATALAEPEAGIALIEAALPGLTPKSTDWIVAELGLGLAAELAVDYDKAAQAYRAVLGATPDESDLLSATIGLARVLTFTDPAAARGYADAALARSDKLLTGKLRDQFGQLTSLRGRIELNDGKLDAARIWFSKALARAGGLATPKISVADVRIRGDLALVYYLLHDEENARKFFAYTGAGQLTAKGFDTGADTPLPACAPAGALARDDMAVVEFTIGEDGRTTSVEPVYALRNNGSAAVFARAVRNWSWRPEVAKRMPAFWRQAVRLELRCYNAPPTTAPGLSIFNREIANWEQGLKLEPLGGLPESEAAALPVLRAELKRRETSSGFESPQNFPVLAALHASTVVNGEETWVTAGRMRALAKANAAPRDIVIALDVVRIAPQPGVVPSPMDLRNADALAALLKDLDAEGAGTGRGAAFAAIDLGFFAQRGRDLTRASLAYQRVIAMPRSMLADGDPLRQTALFQLASVEAAARASGESARALLAAKPDSHPSNAR